MKITKLLFLLALACASAFGQISGAGQLSCNGAPVTGSAWTSATANNTTQVLGTNITGAQVLVTLDQTSTLTGGAVTFQGDPGDGNLVNLASWQVIDPTTAPFAVISNPYTLQATTNKQFLVLMGGMYKLVLKLTTAITGTGQIQPFTTQVCNQLPLSFQATNANLNASVTFPSAQSVNNTQQGTASQNVAQFGGTNISTGTGAGGAGIPRVTISNDSSLAANQSTNVNQFGGSAVVTGTGASGAGIPRVTLSNDSSLAANQSTNVNQVGGSAVSTAASGVQKVGMVGNGAATLDGAPGSAAPTNVLAEGLYDGTNSQRALSDTNGRQFFKPYPDTTTASYHASATVASAASATDIAVLPGNATNKVLVNRISVTCTQTTAGIITLQLIKRSTADTAGTSSNMTVVPDYSAYAAGVSVPKTYTANPTTGTAIGNLDTALIGCMATGTTSPNDIYIFRPLKPIILNGTAEQLAVNLNGATVSGGSFDITFDYSETTTP